MKNIVTYTANSNLITQLGKIATISFVSVPEDYKRTKRVTGHPFSLLHKASVIYKTPTEKRCKRLLEFSPFLAGRD